jgi:hypothetical protein
VKVKEKVSPFSRELDRKIFPGPNCGVTELLIVCGNASRFVHVTIVPAGIVTVFGLKLPFWMVIATTGGGVGVMFTVGTGVEARVVPGTVTSPVGVGEGGAVVTMGTGEVRTGVAVVGAGVCWPPAGPVVQQAISTARMIAPPSTMYPLRGNSALIEVLTR